MAIYSFLISNLAIDRQQKNNPGVRAHNTIELLEDRLYVVTCAKAGFQNSRDEVN